MTKIKKGIIDINEETVDAQFLQSHNAENCNSCHNSKEQGSGKPPEKFYLKEFNGSVHPNHKKNIFLLTLK